LKRETVSLIFQFKGSCKNTVAPCFQYRSILITFTYMKIEIWSDILCPFCYIGKRQLESALKLFPNLEVQLVWKSYQLDPDLVSAGGKNAFEYLAERKGISINESEEMHQNVIIRAAEVGLNYRYDKAVVANSFDAHRLLHLARKYGRANELKELLLKSYFIEGKDISNKQTLIQIGFSIGLQEVDMHTTLFTNQYSQDVKDDIHEARSIGVQGVPFFVFDRKFAVSGAQAIDVFVQTITRTLEEK
jgi:predicted DsbA family dithiol-disulfide isomerase